MRLLRFAGLVITVLVAYAAFLMLNPNTVANLPTAGVFARLTAFYPLLYELIPYRTLLASLAVITFGVLTAPWPLPQWRSATATDQPVAVANRHWVGRSLVCLALVATGGALALRWLRGQEDLTSQLLWAVGVLGYLLACGRLGHGQRAQTTASKQPRHWPSLILILLAALFYFGWQLTTVPMQLETAIVDAGLQTLDLATAPRPQLFTPQTPLAINQTPTIFTALSANLALVPAALLTWLDGDLLLSMRLVGVGSALLFGVSVWLLCGELFRRPLRLLADVTFVDGRGVVMHPHEDDGALPALIATLLVLSNSATLIFSRHPFLLAAAAAGTLGCWALLRGWATGDRLAIGLSGTLLGFAVVCHFSSWSFVGAALCWWVGIVVADSGWLPHYAGRAQLSDPARPRPLRFADFLLWLTGIFVVIAPFGLNLVTTDVAIRTLFTANFPQPLALLSSNLLQMTGTAANATPLFNAWLVPLIALALGSLLFNLDRKQGWMILSWSAVVLLWASSIAFAPAQYDQSILAMLVGLIPPLAAALAFALDRLHITLLRTGGGWLQQFWSYGLLGLLLWVTFQNGVAYYIGALNQSDSISAVGQTLRQATHAESLIVIDPSAQLATAQARNELQVLTTGKGVAFADVTVVPQVPSELAPGTTVIVFGADRALLDAVRAQYAQGTLTTIRAIDANKLLYLYQLP